MTQILLLLYTVLPAALTCLAWRAHVTFNGIDWHGLEHQLSCRPDCDGSRNCPLAVDIYNRQPRRRSRLRKELAVFVLGLGCMGGLLTQLAG